MGLVLAPARAVSTGPTIQLNGVIIPDSSRTSYLRAPIGGRLQAVGDVRWPDVGQHIEAGLVLAQVADARPLAVPQGGTVTQVAARPGEIVQPGQVLIAITDLSHPLARIAWSDEAPSHPPERVTVQSMARPTLSSTAALAGTSLEVDPLTQHPAFRYRLDRTWPGLSVGLPVVTRVPTGALRGHAVAVPASAVVQWEGLLWAFVEEAPGAFRRVRVSGTALADGWAVQGGIEPGQRIVVTGAEQLLSEEFRAQVQVGDEVAE